MEEKIIEIFRKSKTDFVSGEDISNALKVSRAAIWKHIEKLREMGYEFDAVPHLGYRLKKSPDKLYAFEICPRLKTRVIGKKILYYNELDSTNTTAYELAHKINGEGAIVVAEKQNKGKGRLLRHWSSPKSGGIYMSVILRPDITPFYAPIITLMAAVSVAQAIRETSAVEACIKWPNDIIVKDKKVAGILTEMEAESDRVKFIILGIGINVNTMLSELPKTASSIARMSGGPVSRQALLIAIIERLEHNYNNINKAGFSEIRLEWKNLSATLGRRVRANCMHKIIEGTACDIDRDGALKIRTDNGFHEKIFAGDLVVLR
jgi:BirA family transcriptional regulator, biotin operon repressor / biotin---[acetyl-CoA-carboxylase] ligase